jgi:hypothetical protein
MHVNAMLRTCIPLLPPAVSIVPQFHSMTKAAAVDGGNALYQVQSWQWQKSKTESLHSMVMLDEPCAD